MYRNAAYAFHDSLVQILRDGRIMTTRGQEVKELRSHLVKIEYPQERVYVIPERNNDIFAMIAESIWVMAGRNDLEYLSHYLPRAKDFSDDGQVWRGAYGPRLRNWHGIDQFKEVANILNKDRQSRRAVIILFDPSKDFVDSKDIPCNNWLHFMIRDNHLHMSAVIRSNDVMWGFSGINTFEWSVLHEMMSYWTNSTVGDFSFFISSLHLYSRHYERSKKIVESFKDKTLYDFGFAHSQFSTSLEMFDETLNQWFEWEMKIRETKVDMSTQLTAIEDKFLQNCAQMLNIYNLHLAGADPQEIVDLVSSLPSNDFKVAAIEYFTRDPVYKGLFKLSTKENKFFQYFWGETALKIETSGNVHSVKDIYHVLSVLHYKKTLVYKASWKKHGEVIGVFANISRKFDRIETMVVDKVKATVDETLVDTLADLAVYAGKYLTYLAEFYPTLFQEFIFQYPPLEPLDAYIDNLNGFEHLTHILIRRHTVSPVWKQVLDYTKCFDEIRASYKGLDDLLINGDWRANDPRKCTLAADLSISSVHYLSLLTRDDPYNFNRFVRSVDAM